jgi:EmrB/QacA subfamily drug resistance transporter
MEPQNKVLAIMVLGTLMGALDTTIVLLALPTITGSLSTTLVSSIWVILIYLLVIAVTTTQLGRIGDIYGRGRIFNLGFVVFTAGSALCGLSPTIWFLIGFRAVQAFGGALMQANMGAIVADTFEPNRRGRAFGYTSIGWNAGAMLGIVLGGFIAAFVDWRYIFYINIPIGIVATYYGIRYVRDEKKTGSRLDLLGMALLTASLILICYGAIDITGLGVTFINASMIAAGAILIIIFLIAEKKVPNPMVNLAVFKNRVLTYSVFAAFFQSIGYLGVAFILIMYLQGIRGLDPFSASLLLVPGYVISSLASPRMGRLSDRYGARIIATVGILFMMATILIYLQLTVASSLYIVLFASVISGIGASMFWPANSSAIMASADPQHYGSVSGLSRLMSNIGTLASFVIVLTIASLSIPRQTAFSVFIGTSSLIGNVSTQFLTGIDWAFVISLVLLLIGALLSYSRGHENRAKTRPHI